MDLSLLRALSALADHGSMTAAARALHVSQPTLHGQLARLSEALGVRLYRRSGRGLVLTDHGTRALAFARETDERLLELRVDLGQAAARRPVVLAAGQGAFLHLLTPAIRTFCAKGGLLRLLTRSGPEAIDAVRRGDAHLAVAATTSPPEGLESAVIARVGHSVLVPRRHRLARKRSVALADLEGERLIVPPFGAPHREAIARALEAEGVRWDVAVEAHGWDLFAHFARLGLGIAIVNSFVRPPPGVHTRPLRGLEPVTYRVVSRGRLSGPADELRSLASRALPR
jgi:DNA-binding transcriptional LysR family regulator